MFGSRNSSADRVIPECEQQLPFIISPVTKPCVSVTDLSRFRRQHSYEFHIRKNRVDVGRTFSYRRRKHQENCTV